MLAETRKLYYKIQRILRRLDTTESNWQVICRFQDTGIEISPALPSKDFWIADPFLFKYANQIHLFVEFFDQNSNMASIAFSKLIDSEFVPFEICIKEDFHVSFPRIFSFRDKIYMTVESSSQPGVRLYESSSFPTDWTHLYSIDKFSTYVDPIVFIQEEYLYLLATKKNSYKFKELCFMRTQSPESGSWEVSRGSPFQVSQKYARNGGFIKDDDRLIRVSQQNYCGIYGFDINLHEIRLPLEFDAYQEFQIKNDILKKPYYAKQFHTLNVLENLIVFDFKQ